MQVALEIEEGDKEALDVCLIYLYYTYIFTYKCNACVYNKCIGMHVYTFIRYSVHVHVIYSECGKCIRIRCFFLSHDGDEKGALCIGST